jgi:hypothetical protein
MQLILVFHSIHEADIYNLFIVTKNGNAMLLLIAPKKQIFEALACFTTQVQLLLQITFYSTYLTQPKV